MNRGIIEGNATALCKALGIEYNAMPMIDYTRPIRVEFTTIKAFRKDGLPVFFDLGDAPEHKWLNHIRAHAEDSLQVILAVAVVRSMQIAFDYARAGEDTDRLMGLIRENYNLQLVASRKQK